MNKSYLRGRLQTLKNNFALAQLGIALMAEPDALERFDRSLEILRAHPEVESFAYIRYVFDSDKLLKHVTNEFRNAVLRNCLKETFELVKAYAERAGQTTLIRAASWYKFLRIVRNCLSHDMHLRFTTHDLKQLPVSWSGLTIESAMQNQVLPMKDFLSRAKTVELIDAVIGYVDRSIS